MPRIREASLSRMVGFEGVGFFADADELDWHTCYGGDGQGRAAPRVAVHLREYQAGQPDSLVELLGDTYGLLAGHGVHDKEGLGG